MLSGGRRLLTVVLSGLPKARRTIIWLLKLVIPISLGVQLLQVSGLLNVAADWLDPLFRAVGLPGESSIAFVCSLFLPLYAPAAIISTLALTVRQTTILAIMCLISHNLVVESAVQNKTGSSFWFMFFFRIAVSFLAAFSWNAFLPADLGDTMHTAVVQPTDVSFTQVMLSWGANTLILSLKIILIVTGLMILQRVMEAYRIMAWLGRVFAPFMRVMGLSEKSSFLWFVANIVGLTYGGAILIEQIKDGALSKAEARLLNYHLAVSHSLLEDTLLFVALGVPVLWITIPRVLLAIAIVWVILGMIKLSGLRTVKKGLVE